MTPDRSMGKRPSLLQLVAGLPAQLIALVKIEVEQAKIELKAKAISAGIGVGMLVLAAMLAFFAFATLVATAILALTLVFQPWLAALIIGVALLVLAAIIGLVGVRLLKKGVPPVPTAAIEGLKEDVHALKGEGRYEY
ncbi:phage holin family protein [Homoserinimonas sp. OAct 916]|uniref:phage holin family protein n=1 Tax=Homoserinimonas sp. OAct 916 TaxID=2211450 RepID=UPI000DBE4489|nr:phage holin family protein [Homoserinimonas sp. OAct 916]